MKKRNAGFTLIELIAVIVVLGILAAVALPKFVNLSTEARTAKMQGAVGAVQSSITMIHAKWLAAGSPTGATPTITAEGSVALVPNDATDMVNGYPAAEAFRTANENLAGLDSSFTTAATSTSVTTVQDASVTACSFTITESTGSGIPPVVSAVSGC